MDRVIELDGFSREEILRLAGGLEQYSGHPMAQAVVQAATAAGDALPHAEAVVEAAGQGVRGIVDGHRVDIGSFAYALERSLASQAALDAARSVAGSEDDAMSVVGIDDRAVGLVVYVDPIRPAIPALMQRLRQLGVRGTAMLTGDDPATAHAVAEAAGITEAHAELLPADKVEAVKAMTRDGDTVVMVGDGINDAPALAAATIGIALGARGAAIAAEAADIVLTTDDVDRVADTMEIGRNTLKIAKQSIWIGLGVSGLLTVIAAFGYIPPAVGALLQEALDASVILNALRARS